MSRTRRLLAIGFALVAILLCLSYWHVLPYRDGWSRARNDLKYQNYSFPKGHGYLPASTFTDDVAHLYVGYPEEDFLPDTTLSQRYIRRWLSGYAAGVARSGYSVQRTNGRPVALGNSGSEQVSGADADKLRSTE